MESSKLLTQSETRHPQSSPAHRSPFVVSGPGDPSNDRLNCSGIPTTACEPHDTGRLPRHQTPRCDGSQNVLHDDLATPDFPRNIYQAPASSSPPNLPSNTSAITDGISATRESGYQPPAPNRIAPSSSLASTKDGCDRAPSSYQTSDPAAVDRKTPYDHSEAVCYRAPHSSNTPHDYSNHAGDFDLDKSPTGAVQELQDCVNSDKRRCWTSLWLRKQSLISLAVLFASLAAALIALSFMDAAEDGFATTLSTNHYAWTYGPTAVLIVVLSFWRQVDYHCKMMQPWRDLRKGPVAADRSLLLDYLSPLQATSFIQAIRYRHIPVAATIAGFAILKAVVLVSTGLLVLAPVSVTEPHAMTLTTAFDDEGFWEAGRERGEIVYTPSTQMDTTHAWLRTLSQQALDNENHRDLVAAQSFELTSPDLAHGLVSISADIDSFRANMSCEIAKPTFRIPAAGDLVVQLESSSCAVGQRYQSNLDFSSSLPRSCNASCPTYFASNVWQVNCSEVDNSSAVVNPLRNIDTPHDLRMAMLVANMENLNLTYEPNVGRESQSHNQLIPDQAAAVICRFDYSMHRSAVLRNLMSGTTTSTYITTLPHFNNLTSIILGEVVHRTLTSTIGLYSNLPNGAITSLFAALLQTLDGQRSLDRLLVNDTLSSAVVETWEGLSTQIMRDKFLKPAHSEVNGTVIRVEDRLRIGAASLWIMVVGLILLFSITSYLLVVSKPGTVPGDPGLMSTEATILISSPSLHNILRHCGSMRTSELTNMLSGTEFSTDDSNGFQISAAHDGPLKRLETIKVKTKAWAPLPAKPAMICLTLATPVAAIIVLEIMYRISRTNDGLIDISGSEETATYTSRYASALIVLLIATCYNGLDFTTATFAPYSCLRSGAVSASRGLNLQILGSLPPMALFRSARSRHVSSFCSNLAGTIGSTLAIVASGLWVIDRAVPTERVVAASYNSAFDIDWRNSSHVGDGGAAAVFDTVQHGNGSLPLSIWNGIVLPSISDIRSFTDLQSALNVSYPRNYTFPVHGLRPLLSCEVVDDEHISIEYLEATQGQVLYVRAAPPVPPGCQQIGKSVLDSYYNFTSSHTIRSSDVPVHMGDFYDLNPGPWDPAARYYSDEDMRDLVAKQDNPAGCPSIGAIFAESDHNVTHHDDVTVIMCKQKIQEVQVNVTYSVPEFDDPAINAEIAPVLIEGITRNLTNGTDGIDAFPYRLQTYLQETRNEGDLVRFDQDHIGLLDGFMDHLIFGPDGTPQHDMAGKAHRQTFINAVGALYAKYMGLVIDMRFRRKVGPDETDPLAVLVGTESNFSSRLRVNEASKLTMQVMLGIMIMLGTLTYLLTDLRGTLPRKPTSIASRMALLAGSDLCDAHRTPLPPNASWMRKQELDKSYDGWLFSLGWWSEGIDTAHVGRAAQGEGNISAREERQKSMRFGIDVGTPEQLGFQDTKWRALRRRLAQRKS